MQEFSEQELHELVDKALAAAAMPKPEPSPVKEHKAIPIPPMVFPEISYLEIDLIEQFHNSMVDKGVDAKIRSEILSDLRGHLMDAPKSKVLLEELRTRVANCRKCEEAADKPRSTVGNTVNPRLLFILATPGSDLQRLTEYLDRYGFDKTECGLTYVTRCPLSANITESAIKNCANYLFAEIDYLQPELIVPVGAIPLRVLAGQVHLLNEAHGKAFWLGTLRLFPLFTPTYAEKSNKIMALETDIELLKQVAYA
jgi:uracil-DNA glycosylase family 4